VYLIFLNKIEKTEKITIVSSIGYVVLSGKIHVERQETHFWTPVSWQHFNTF